MWGRNVLSSLEGSAVASRLTPEERIARFLANPPRRISDEAKRARRAKSCRRALKKGVLQSLFDLQCGRCYYCRVQMTMRRKDGKNRATIDHYVPLALGGSNARENLVSACEDCNRRKANLTAEAYLVNLAKRAQERAVWGKRMAAGLPCKMAGHDENGNRALPSDSGSRAKH